MAYRATVSDEMTFTRVLETNGFRARFPYEALDDARSEGYSRGLAAGRASQQPTPKP